VPDVNLILPYALDTSTPSAKMEDTKRNWEWRYALYAQQPAGIDSSKEMLKLLIQMP
jgi:hypothetical protein